MKAEARRREIAEFNRTGWAEKVAAARPPARRWACRRHMPSPCRAWVRRSPQYHTDGSTRPATLRKQMTATDGTLVNVWVEDSQYNVVNGIGSSVVDDLGAALSRHGQDL